MGIEQRVHDTVVSGRGTHPRSNAAAMKEKEPSFTIQMRYNEFKRCSGCSRIDQHMFVKDIKNGDVICHDYGTVVEECLAHEGSQFRKFEGEADRNHHGDVADRHFSNSYNVSTSIGGMSFQSGAGLGGYGGGGGVEKVL